MACTRELAPMYANLAITSTTAAHLWDPNWYAVMGVDSIDFMADLRNATLPGGATFAVKPALQFAAIRTDRPDAGAAIGNGSDITTNSATHFVETVSAATKFWFRRGLSFKLTAGSFATADVTLHTSFRACGVLFPAREIVFQPWNDTAASSYFPIIPPTAAGDVDKAKAAILQLDNFNNKMEWRLAGRGFNDPSARGNWVDLQAGWNASIAGDDEYNTGEVSLSGLSLASYQWFELALAVRKDLQASANSRCIFQLVPSIRYV